VERHGHWYSTSGMRRSLLGRVKGGALGGHVTSFLAFLCGLLFGEVTHILWRWWIKTLTKITAGAQAIRQGIPSWRDLPQCSSPTISSWQGLAILVGPLPAYLTSILSCPELQTHFRGDWLRFCSSLSYQLLPSLQVTA
jgi:hypothetical protein